MSKPAQFARTSISDTTTTIPPFLSNLGVVAVTKHQSGYDLSFELEFFDGDKMEWNPDGNIRDKTAKDVEQKIQELVNAIQEHREQG